MSIDIVHATHMCLWGSQIPTSQLSHQPLWGVAQDLDSFLQSASLLPSQRWPSYHIHHLFLTSEYSDYLFSPFLPASIFPSPLFYRKLG